MSFLNDGNVQFGYTGVTEYANCGGLLQETGLYYEQDLDPASPTYEEWILKQAVYNNKLILTDGVSPEAPGQPQVIYLDDCETSQITYPCNEPVGLIAEGKSIDIVNVCDMPITITGFVNSDPTRFTILSQEFKGVETYTTGNVSTDYLPATIAPYTKLTIPTFFHPSRNEIEDGREGSWENRTGDAWHSKISVYPGFPIVNCETNNCDTSFIVSGELVCDALDREPLLNYGNYEGYYSCEDLNALGGLEFENCLLSSGMFSDITDVDYDKFFALQGLSEQIPKKYCKDDPSFKAAIATFKKAIFEQSSIEDMLDAFTIEVVEFGTAKVTGTYVRQNERIYFDGIEFTGMHISIETEDPGTLVSNMSVFFNTERVDDSLRENNIFLSEQGDFVNEGFCFSPSFVELDAARYFPFNDITLSNSDITENLPAGTFLGQLGVTE